MDNNNVQLVGGPCGQHGPYTFYKAFKYTKNGIKRVVNLSDLLIVKLWVDSDLLCIGELQLLWNDKNSEQVLASLRLYFLPENTPDGRKGTHGEDEVLAINEKVVIRVEDLITWITYDVEWTWVEELICQPGGFSGDDRPCNVLRLTENSLGSDEHKEETMLDSQATIAPVIILSYPRYCRYRTMLKRLENVEDEALKHKIMNALGGFPATSKNTRILFCRDTFKYSEIEGHELVCNHLSPKLKGRPRGRRKKRSVSPASESNESESSASNTYTSGKQKISSEGGRNGLLPRRSTRSMEVNEGREFIKKLYQFMKANHTPIGRIPSLGFKELDLFDFFTKVQKLGGYDAVTTNRLWKSIFDEMSGHQNSTSAATVIRRHYERFLLPYERNIKGEQHKPLPVSERRRLKSKAGSSSSEPGTSTGTSSGATSGSTSPLPSTSSQSPLTITPIIPSENKDQNIKSEGKTSSLRSVRVKPERQKEKQTSNDKSPLQNHNNNNITIQESKSPVKEELIECTTEIIEIKPKSETVVPEPSPIKSVVKSELEIVPIKMENEVKRELSPIKIESANIPDKDAEPLTSAVAPVAQKITPEKSMSPIEGKENIPLIKTGDTATEDSKSPEVIEVPFKAKSPEIVILESETFKNINVSISSTFIHEVKKRKLDILKEGGLEVTPVRPNMIPAIKDTRPSVIHQANSKTDVQTMPPPASNSVPSKRLNITIPQSLNISQVTVQKQSSKPQPPLNSFSYANGSAPPKVVQSKSIYSYSEKTVYGNPKEGLIPSTTCHTPRFVGSSPRQSGGDLLDLSVTSPQKPMVEIMRVPQVSSAYNRDRDSVAKNFCKSSSALLEGRKLGSNLEITLVGPQSKASSSSNKYFPHSSSLHLGNKYHSHKRMSSDQYVHAKVPKIEENGKFAKPIPPQYPSRDVKSNLDINIPNPYINRSPSIKSDPVNSHVKAMAQMQQQGSKQYPGATSSQYPAYFSQLYENKNLNPYLPLLDPIYYTAMQQLYSGSNSMNSVTPSLLPFTTPEQLKFYTDLMAQNARLPFPFQMPQEGNPSITNNNLKKP